jgi:hypothetical protein
MRLSDFHIPDAPIPVAAKVMARNAKAAAARVNWQATRIVATEGARESSPYGRDDEPEPSSSDEPEEDDDEEFSEPSVMDSLFRRLRAILHSADVAKRPKLSGHRSYACDQGALSVREYERLQRREQAHVI